MKGTRGTLTRRTALGAWGLATTAGVLGACAPGAPAPPAAQKGAATPLRIWFHWGTIRGETVQKMMDDYNATQGQTDKNVVSVETVRDVEMLTKMTASVVGGDPPDVWHMNATPRVASERGLIVSVPKDDEAYIKRNYVPGAIERMTLGGKLWGYPTEFQSPAFVYRKSHFREAGLTGPPDTTDAVYEQAAKLTRKAGNAGRALRLPRQRGRYASVLPSLIARFGGQMIHFNGDKPAKVDVASAAALEAVGWWKRFVDAGYAPSDPDALHGRHAPGAHLGHGVLGLVHHRQQPQPRPERHLRGPGGRGGPAQAGTQAGGLRRGLGPGGAQRGEAARRALEADALDDAQAGHALLPLHRGLRGLHAGPHRVPHEDRRLDARADPGLRRGHAEDRPVPPDDPRAGVGRDQQPP